MNHESGRLGVLARIAAFSLMALGAFVSGAQAAVVRQADDGFPTAACEEPSVGAGVASVSAATALAPEPPPGIALAMLADAATEAWPPFARGLVLTVRHLTLDPGVASASRQSQGPVLFYVESGSVSVSVNGQPRVVGLGEALLIERGKNYQLRNEDLGTSAMLVRVQIVPPGGETKVSRGEIAMAIDDEQALAPGPPFIASQLLLSADVPAVDGLAHIVLACVTWNEGSTDADDAVHPGPVALLVLEGELLVGDSGSLGAGQCTVFQRNAPSRLGAGEPAPTVLMIAVVPDGAPLWAAAGDAGAAPGRSSFSCDPAAAPDAIPDSAWLTPSGGVGRAPL